MAKLAAQLHEVLRQLVPQRLEQGLLAAVNAYSPTFEEQPATEIFALQCQEAGLVVQRQEVPHPQGGAPRHNLLIQLGPQPLGLVLVGHVDTIVAGTGEMAFTGAQLQGDVLTGLGAADMKGGCVAMIEAMRALKASGVTLDRGVALALVVGEEEYGDGSAALPADLVAPLVLVGEPTSMQPCVRHFGYLEQRLAVHGERAHAALSAQGGSAIHGMLAWLLSVLDGFAAAYPGGQVAANPRLIRGGDSLFVVAEHCEALLDIHWHPDLDPQVLIRHLETLRAASAVNHPPCRFERETLFQSNAFAYHHTDPRMAPAQEAMAATHIPWQPSEFPSHSDAGLFHERGALTLVCGPGALTAAHAAGESVTMQEVLKAAEFYAACAVLACGETAA